MWRTLTLGRRGERAAKRYLRRRGYRILRHSYVCPSGEVDLVASIDSVVVFVEVKTRVTSKHGAPWQAVDARKQRQITRAAVHFLKAYRLTDRPARFDIIAITWPPGWFRAPVVEHFESAFDAKGSWST